MTRLGYWGGFYNEYNTIYAIGCGQIHRSVDWTEFYSDGFIARAKTKKLIINNK